jgi:DNA-binding NtrC family response regulator
MFTDECSSAAGDADRGGDGDRGHGRPDGGSDRGSADSAVLIVEDEHVARRALTALLSASGYVIKATGSAEEALALLDRPGAPPPRIMLVDLNLPGMSGLDFIRRVGQLDPTVTTVLMTGAGEEALAAALDEYRKPVPLLRKPLDFRRLLAVITEREPAL